MDLGCYENTWKKQKMKENNPLSEKRMRLINAMRAKPELYYPEMIKKLEDTINDPSKLFDQMFMKIQLELPSKY